MLCKGATIVTTYAHGHVRSVSAAHQESQGLADYAAPAQLQLPSPEHPQPPQQVPNRLPLMLLCLMPLLVQVCWHQDWPVLPQRSCLKDWGLAPPGCHLQLAIRLSSTPYRDGICRRALEVTEREIGHAWLHGRAQGLLGLALVHAGRAPGAVPGLDPQAAQIQALRHLQSAHRMEPHDLYITYNLALLLVC